MYKSFSYGQQSSGGVPVSLRINENFAIPTIQLPYIDNAIEKLKTDTIKNKNCESCKTGYYGKVLNSSVELTNTGYLQTLSDGGKLWRVRFESSSAYALQFYFDKFHLPFGATLFIFNEDSSMILGAFTSKNNPSNPNQAIPFGTQLIEGKKIVLEYYEPSHVEFSGELRVAKAVHVFVDFFHKELTGDLSGPCNKDVACAEGAIWEKEINSVAAIVYRVPTGEYGDYMAFGSGALINNTAQDGKPYFLTANHVYNNNVNIFDFGTWIFWFNYQNKVCGTYDSPENKSIYGATMLSQDPNSAIVDANSDYLLLQLNTDKEYLSSIGACFSGWTLSTNPQKPFTGIHHPQGDPKKISISNQNLISSTFKDNLDDSNGNFWRVPKWDIGVMEDFSSGSPLFDGSHRIVGQLAGGNSECTSPTTNNGESELYGKFYKSWVNGGFATWLDPGNTGATSIDTYCPTSTVTSPTGTVTTGGSGSEQDCRNVWYKVPLTMGMIINGSNVETPCIDGEITLYPYPTEDCGEANWEIEVTKEELPESTCDNPNAFNCEDPLNPFLGCICYFYYFFIEIVEVNDTYQPYAQTYHSKWLRNSAASVNLKNISIHSIVIDNNDLSELGVTLKHGSLYRIKLAFNKQGWVETTKYFRVKPKDIELQGNFDLLEDITGTDIILSGMTIVNNITVTATNSISILPNTVLKAGTYKIANNLCLSPMRKMKSIVNETIPYNGSFYEENYQENSVSNTSDENGNLINEKQNNALIFPNPTNSHFTILIKGNNLSGTETILELSTFMGEKFFKRKTFETSIDVNLNDTKPGIYFLKVITLNKNFIYKIIKN